MFLTIHSQHSTFILTVILKFESHFTNMPENMLYYLIRLIFSYLLISTYEHTYSFFNQNVIRTQNCEVFLMAWWFMELRKE